MFLKQTRSGKVKACGCLDRWKQCMKVPHCVSLRGFITAKDWWAVKAVDVRGAFMQEDMPDLVHVQFTGEMVNKLLEIDKDTYEPCGVFEHEEKVLYVELLKALYRNIKAVYLFWEQLAKHVVTDWGFTINPYDHCIANKTVNGHQCAIVWHIDDLKISNLQERVVKDMIQHLNKECSSHDPMTVSNVKIHDYLGMTLDYTRDGTLKDDMIAYIEGILEEVPQDMKGASCIYGSKGSSRYSDCNCFPTNLGDQT